MSKLQELFFHFNTLSFHLGFFDETFEKLRIKYYLEVSEDIDLIKNHSTFLKEQVYDKLDILHQDECVELYYQENKLKYFFYV